MLLKWALLVALGCSLTVAGPVFAAVPIPVSSLALRTSDLPGFENARTNLHSTSSAASFAGPGETREAAILQRDGFREGVSQEFGNAEDGSALSTAVVVRTAQAARQLLRANISGELGQLGTGRRFTVAAIPRSFGARETSPGFSGTGQAFATGVLFSTGRCFFEVLTVFDSTRPTSTPERVKGAAIAGATALFVRARTACA
jgi:hypothetical protein